MCGWHFKYFSLRCQELLYSIKIPFILLIPIKGQQSRSITDEEERLGLHGGGFQRRTVLDSVNLGRAGWEVMWVFIECLRTGSASSSRLVGRMWNDDIKLGGLGKAPERE